MLKGLKTEIEEEMNTATQCWEAFGFSDTEVVIGGCW